MKSTILFSILFMVVFSSCKTNTNEEEDMQPAEILTSVLEESLKNKIVNVWYPQTIDSIHGGFFSDFNAKWEKQGMQNKMIVTQARHVWTASTLASFYDDSSYKEIAKHGYMFLREHMWDNENVWYYKIKSIDADSLKLFSTCNSTYGN